MGFDQPEKQQQGRQAVFNGLNLERDLMHRLRSHGYQQWSAPPTLFAEAFFVHQYHSPFMSIYETPLLLDFFVLHPWKHPEGLIIEAKYQDTNGSIDEKYPYTIANLKGTGKPVLLILLCSAARKEAIRWCQRQQTDRFTVLTQWDEWVRLLNKGFL